MTDLVPLFPRRAMPPLQVDLAGGGTFDLAREEPANFTLLVFYRGLHCPICKTQLRELESKLEEFDRCGIIVRLNALENSALLQRSHQSVQSIMRKFELAPTRGM